MPAPDHSDIESIEKRFKLAAKRLHALAPEMATAITVIDLHSDRRKNMLARYSAPRIDKDGLSAASADTLARADKAYETEFQTLLSQYESAQSVKHEFEVEKISWETARSLLARQRETLKTLPETEA
jgi:hypothetical protein